MPTAKVIDYPDLRKIDGAYVVNTNRSQYDAALSRKRNTRKVKHIEERLANTEKKLDEVLTILKGLTK